MIMRVRSPTAGIRSVDYLLARFALLRREGWPIHAKRVYRPYKLERLPMRHKPPRGQVSAASTHLQIPKPILISL